MITVFLLANIRSGSRYLSHLLRNNVAGCVSMHEPMPDMFGRPIHWRLSGEHERIRSLFRWKVRRIALNRPRVYFESNHAFLKSFCDVAIEHFPRMKLIHPVRSPLEVAKSAVNRRRLTEAVRFPLRYYRTPAGERLFRWTLTGQEPIYRDCAISSPTLLQHYLLEWLHVENEAVAFLERHDKWSDCYALDAPDGLADEATIREMLEQLGLPFKGGAVRWRGGRNRNHVPTVITCEDRRQLQELIDALPPRYLEIFARPPYAGRGWSSMLCPNRA